jgi:hypothetical protein
MPDISDTITQAPKSVYKNAWGAKLTANLGFAQGNVNTLTTDGQLLLYTRIGKRVAGYVDGGLTIKSKPARPRKSPPRQKQPPAAPPRRKRLTTV